MKSGPIIIDYAGAVVEKLEFFGIDGKQDAIRITGNDAREIEIRDCIFDNSEIPWPQSDEAISIVRGATDVLVKNCKFRDWDKTILIGTGDDEWRQAESNVRVHFENCIFEECGRRHPYIRYGFLQMRNCTIRNWGLTHCPKSYGIKAVAGAEVVLENISFEHNGLLKMGLSKLASHIKQAIGNRLNGKTLDWPWAAVIKDRSSKVKMKNCKFEHCWMSH